MTFTATRPKDSWVPVYTSAIPPRAIRSLICTFPSVFPAQSAIYKIITENEDGYNPAKRLMEVNVPAPLESQVGQLLQKRGLKLVLAESCTGGLLGSRITDV